MKPTQGIYSPYSEINPFQIHQELLILEDLLSDLTKPGYDQEKILLREPTYKFRSKSTNAADETLLFNIFNRRLSPLFLTVVLMLYSYIDTSQQ
jgi:hypothetical protein